jgi:hypothetical protein
MITLRKKFARVGLSQVESLDRPYVGVNVKDERFNNNADDFKQLAFILGWKYKKGTEKFEPPLSQNIGLEHSMIYKFIEI